MNRPEQALQIAVARYLDAVLTPATFWTAINPVPGKGRSLPPAKPGGKRRAPAAAGIAKAMGLKAGVPDLLLVHQGQTLMIELKADDGTLQQEQKDMVERLGQAGVDVAVCRSLDAVRAVLGMHRIPTRERVAA